MASEVRTHLESPAARGLGPPDCVLLLGASRYPVHRAVVARGSGLLRQLLEEFGGSDEGGAQGGASQPEICLLSIAGAGASSSASGSAGLSAEQLEVLSDVRLFANFLERLYSPTSTAPLPDHRPLSAARQLLALADFFDSPQLLPELDSCLVASMQEVSNDVSTPGTPLLSIYEDASRRSIYHCSPRDLSDYLDLAVQFGLRRTMAEVLAVLSLGHLFRNERQVSEALGRVGAEPLAALTEFLLALRFAHSPTECECLASGGHSICRTCLAIMTMARLQAVTALEKLLLQRGWGYRRS